MTKTASFAYLDGLRGLAALSVVVNHCLLVFFPAVIEGSQTARSHNAFEAMLPFSPFNWLFSGGFSVSLFFVLSGFVLSIGYFKKRQKSVIGKAILKRYPRLLIPTFFVSLLSFLLLHHHLYCNVLAAKITHSHWFASCFQFEPSFLLFVKETLVNVFLKQDQVSFNPVLWTMHVEFLGSFLVFALLLIVGAQKKLYRYAIYAALTLLLILTDHTIYTSFIMGMAMCDLAFQLPNGFKRQQGLGLVLLFLALFLGNIPIGLSESPALLAQTVYAPLLLMRHVIKGASVRSVFMFWEMLAATFALAAVLNLQKAQRFLASKSLVWLGRVSFMLYLVHVIILFSLGASLFMQVMAMYPDAYNVAALLSSVVVIGLSLLLAHLLTPLLDESSVAMSVNFADHGFKWYVSKVEFLYRFGGGLYASFRKTSSQN